MRKKDYIMETAEMNDKYRGLSELTTEYNMIPKYGTDDDELVLKDLYIKMTHLSNKITTLQQMVISLKD